MTRGVPATPSRTPRPPRTGRRLFTAGLAGVLCTVLLAPSTARATSTPTQVTSAVTSGVAYLKTLQRADGGFAGAGLSNEWAFSAFAAAGVAVVDLTPGGDTSRDARTVYRGLLADPAWPGAAPVATDYQRAVLNTYAAGIDPARVSAGRNLIADVASYWQPTEPGYWGPSGLFNGTIFGLLALAGAKTSTGARRVPQRLLDASISVVRANQHTDGGWNFGKAEGNPSQLAATSDIDMTGAALAALCSGGVPNTDAAVQAGKNFLKRKLVNASGAFTALFGPNANSNGWAVSGLNACGFPSQGTEFTTTAGKTPVDFLRTLQVLPGGGFRYQPSSTGATAYPSIDAVRALAGGGFTAAPPTPVTAGTPRWVASTGFTPGQASTVAVVVDAGTSTGLRVCAVRVTPTGATTTLGAVLDAAAGGAAAPAGCVTGHAPASGGGTVTSINGVGNTGGTSWRFGVDGGAEAPANRDSVVNLGDTVSLRYGS
ncbi:prenyltransferase/squalene oxidase repeat-containing protein [Plantactinospora sonchi]|uniref:Prenyltransferase/squalene oxidase repeat-containing protein n=1 Tax=Plantactinospora sonchi TaxID=1544735 RepID=A0ABU7RZQ1_9ACTN